MTVFSFCCTSATAPLHATSAHQCSVSRFNVSWREKMPMKSNIDDVMSVLGFGRWQIPFILLNFLIQLYVPIHIIGSTLLSVPMPFRCFSPLVAPTEEMSNVSSATTANHSLTLAYDSVCEPVNQTMFPPPPSAHLTTLPSCPVLEYDSSRFPNTVISEFDLVCERSVLRPLFQMSISLGIPCGALLGGVMSDKYGRKTMIVAGSVLNGVGVMALAACPWYLGVLGCCFFLGMMVSFALLPSYTLSQEITPPRIWSQAGMLLGFAFPGGVALIAGIGYLVRPWRFLLLTVSSILFIIIPWACKMDESPRWLVQRGRRKEAAAILERAARRNGVSRTPQLVAALENLRTEKVEDDAVDERNVAEGVHASLSGLWQCFGACRNYFHYPALRMILLVSPAVWYLQCLLYMGIMFNANNFTSNDPFLYVATLGVVGCCAITLAIPLTMRVGRRPLLMIMYSVSGVLLLLDLAIPADTRGLKWAAVIVAFLMSSAGYQIQFMYTPELYPTIMRSLGFGLSNGTGSLGILTAPIVTDLLVQRTWWSVNLVCGTAGLVASLLVHFLPETRNMAMPETVADVEKRRRNLKEMKDTNVKVEMNWLRNETE